MERIRNRLAPAAMPRGLPRGISERSRRGWGPAASAKKMAGLFAFAVALLLAVVVPAREASAYSVLAHEANVDALWDSPIRPLLVRRFPPRRHSNCSMPARSPTAGR